MKYGCCGCMIATEEGGTGIEIIDELSAIGYDYIELSLAHIMALPEPDFINLKKRVQDSNIGCEACNNFFPSSIRLTGTQSNINKTMEYCTRALNRASQLGVEVIVFGSASAKNVPDGFSNDQAWRQLVEMLKTISPAARNRGITIAIEPLNKIESNIINTLQEALDLIKQVNRDNIKLLADFYHMTVANEPFDVILNSGEYIKHVHFAEVLERSFPKLLKEDYLRFFRYLKNAGYKDRVSVEAYSKNFLDEAATSLKILKSINEQLKHDDNRS